MECFALAGMVGSNFIFCSFILHFFSQAFSILLAFVLINFHKIHFLGKETERQKKSSKMKETELSDSTNVIFFNDAVKKKIL